jgi:hypothetical protein
VEDQADWGWSEYLALVEAALESDSYWQCVAELKVGEDRHASLLATLGSLRNRQIRRHHEGPWDTSRAAVIGLVIEDDEDFEVYIDEAEDRWEAALAALRAVLAAAAAFRAIVLSLRTGRTRTVSPWPTLPDEDPRPPICLVRPESPNAPPLVALPDRGYRRMRAA